MASFDQTLAAADRLVSALAFTPAERLLYIHLLRLSCHSGCHPEESAAADDEGSASRPSGISDLKSAMAPAAPQRLPSGHLGADQTPDHQSSDRPIPFVLVTKRQLASAIGVCPTTVRHALRALARAGCIRIVALLGRRGFHLEIVPPSHNPPLEPGTQPLAPRRGKGRSTGRFRSRALRDACFARQHGRCFYCLRLLDPEAACSGGLQASMPASPSEISDHKSAVNHPITRWHDRRFPSSWALDHVVSVASGGDDSASNAVACCHLCNCAKGEMPAADFLRSLYRRGVLTSRELTERLEKLRTLRSCPT